MPVRVLAVLAGSFLAACGALAGPMEGSGRIARTALPVAGEFTGLAVEGALVVEVSPGPAATLAAEADDNLLPLLRAEVAGGVLRVWTEGPWTSKTTYTVRIAAPSLTSVAAAGAARVRVAGAEGLPRFAVKASDASVVEARVRCDEVEINAEGSAKVSGTSSRTAKVIVSGATRVDLDVDESLHASATGAAAVRYGGQPEVDGLVGTAASVKPR